MGKFEWRQKNNLYCEKGLLDINILHQYPDGCDYLFWVILNPK